MTPNETSPGFPRPAAIPGTVHDVGRAIALAQPPALAITLDDAILILDVAARILEVLADEGFQIEEPAS